MNVADEKRLSRMVFLGTGTSQGVPIIGCHCEVCASDDVRDQRLRTSVALETQSSRVVIDTGPDFRVQMLREGIEHLDAVVYTHEHKDHLAGMDDVRPFNYIQKRAMALYASARVEEALKRDFHYAFDKNKHGGVPDVTIERVTDDDNFMAGGMTWQPLPIMHGSLAIHGYRIDDVAYITDANDIPDATLSNMQNLEILVLNALRHSPHYSHFSLQEALEVAEKIGAQRTYFTHISHIMGLHGTLKKELPRGFQLAYDGLTLVREDNGWQERHSPWLSQLSAS